MFVIRWTRSARDQLARLWLKADSTTRKAITQASHRLDVMLENSPRQQGESRESEYRIYFDVPLGVMFRIDDVAKEVVVFRVWRWNW